MGPRDPVSPGLRGSADVELAWTLLLRRLMKALSLLLAAVFVICFSSGRAEADTWSKDDWIYGPLAGAAGGTAGALAGGLAGSLLDGRCLSSDNDCVPAFTLAGLASGLIIGSAYGVSFYGKKRGLGGSFRSAVIGSLLGHVASGSVIVLAAKTIDEPAIGFPIVFAALVGMPAIGSTIAYKRSAGGEPSDERISGALIDVTPDRIKLSPPAIGFAVTKSETAVLIPLAGGTF